MNKGLFLLVAIPALLAVACGPPRDGKSSESSPRDSAPPAVPEIESARKDFSFAAGGKVTLPTPFPEDLPLLPEFVLRMAQRHNETDVTVILGTSSPIGEVERFYRRTMEEAGWQFINEAALGVERFLRFEKGEKVAAIVLGTGERETVVSLAYKETSMWRQ